MMKVFDRTTMFLYNVMFAPIIVDPLPQSLQAPKIDRIFPY